MFPWIMLVGLTLFFTPSWPRTWVPALGPAPRLAQPPPWRWTLARRWTVAALVPLLLLQVVVPARAFLYSGDVLWHEQGMRFAWKVMVREKNGSVTYRVKTDRWPREKHVYPSAYLTPHQEREMAGQPDQILQLGHHIAAQLRQAGHHDVQVRVDALASLNGRRMSPLIDPDVDLAKVEDSLGPAPWIMPAPTGPPLKLRPLRRLSGTYGGRR
jgi:hypothetical protein